MVVIRPFITPLTIFFQLKEPIPFIQVGIGSVDSHIFRAENLFRVRTERNPGHFHAILDACAFDYRAPFTLVLRGR